MFVVLLTALIHIYPASAETCATTMAELAPEVRELFLGSDRAGLVNETKGSYVVIETRNEKLWIKFLTSGPFNLFAISEEGPLKLCDGPAGMIMSGLNRDSSYKIVDGKLVIGTGGERKTFAPGDLPDHLQRLHHLNSRAMASEL